jgi:hypothetical protein
MKLTAIDGLQHHSTRSKDKAVLKTASAAFAMPFSEPQTPAASHSHGHNCPCYFQIFCTNLMSESV